jgi:hypothetical protein
MTCRGYVTAYSVVVAVQLLTSTRQTDEEQLGDEMPRRDEQPGSSVAARHQARDAYLLQ